MGPDLVSVYPPGVLAQACRFQVVLDFPYFISVFKKTYCFIFGCAESSLSLGSFSGCGDRGPLFIATRGLLTAAASLVVAHGLQGTRASAVAAGELSGSSSQALERRPNNRGTRA